MAAQVSISPFDALYPIDPHRWSNYGRVPGPQKAMVPLSNSDLRIERVAGAIAIHKPQWRIQDFEKGRGGNILSGGCGRGGL